MGSFFLISFLTHFRDHQHVKSFPGPFCRKLNSLVVMKDGTHISYFTAAAMLRYYMLSAHFLSTQWLLLADLNTNIHYRENSFDPGPVASVADLCEAISEGRIKSIRFQKEVGGYKSNSKASLWVCSVQVSRVVLLCFRVIRPWPNDINPGRTHVSATEDERRKINFLYRIKTWCATRKSAGKKLSTRE